jgi:hypothetical protein
VRKKISGLFAVGASQQWVAHVEELPAEGVVRMRKEESDVARCACPTRVSWFSRCVGSQVHTALQHSAFCTFLIAVPSSGNIIATNTQIRRELVLASSSEYSLVYHSSIQRDKDMCQHSPTPVLRVQLHQILNVVAAVNGLLLPRRCYPHSRRVETSGLPLCCDGYDSLQVSRAIACSSAMCS